MAGRFPDKMVRKDEGDGFAGRRVEDEASVIAAAKSGHGGSFEFLVERYERRVFLLALRITQNVEDAEDVKQQSFQKAFAHLQEFKGQSCFSTWLTRIAINEALILLRRRRRWREVSVEETSNCNGGGNWLEIADSGPGPEANYLEQERKCILSLALDELTPGVRIAVQLRELEERSTRETAQILGISVFAAKSRLFHGKRKLREVLGRCPQARIPSLKRAVPSDFQ